MPGYIGYESEYDLGGINSIKDSANSIVRNGLVLYLDAANINSYDPKENLVSNSFYNATTWNNIFPAGATITTGIDAPDGSLNAVRFSGSNTTAALLRVGIPSVTPNGTETYTISFYVRKISGTTGIFRVDFADGLPQLDYIGQLVTNQWVRIVNSGVPTATAKTFIDVFNGSTTNHVVDFWGLQLERGPVATNHVQTNGSIVSGLGTTNWIDISGNAINGTLTNGPTYSSENGGSIVFDGSNDEVQVPGTSLSLNLMTISSWNFSSNYQQNGFMFEKTTNGNVNTQYSLFFGSDNNIYFRTYGLSITDLVANTSSSGVINNSWNNIVATWDGFNKRIYVNGVLRMTSNTLSGTVTQNNTGLAYIGRHGAPSAYPFSGRISKTQIYNKALTLEEIQQNFNAIRGRYGI